MLPGKDQLQLPATYQSHSSEDGDAVDALDREVDEAGYDDDEVEDVPAAGEVLLGDAGGDLYMGWIPLFPYGADSLQGRGPVLLLQPLHTY